MKNGPIVIIDDDVHEIHLYKKALENLNVKNKLLFFENGILALEHLQNQNDHPFLIICDMKMPKMDGFDLREKINEDPYLKKKSIPFIFRTGTATHKDVNKAFDLTVQGFFEKTHDYKTFERQIKIIIDYWKEGLEPNWDLA